jgi:hypothetical protein
MQTEQLDIQGATFSGTSNSSTNTIVLTVKNSGTSDVTVDKYKLGLQGTAYDITNVIVAQGNTASVTCTTGTHGAEWISGTTYDIYVITATGEQFMYRATAP